MTALDDLPIAVIGSGPVGLAAAAHLITRGLPVKIYEAGQAVATNVRNWGHVRVFTPWRYCIDATARKLLERRGWRTPNPDAFPTGDELARDYIEPLAALPEFAGVIETGARVSAISRIGYRQGCEPGSGNAILCPHCRNGRGVRRDRARAVIDASGTWQTPNPLGAAGFPRKERRRSPIKSPTEFPISSGRSRRTYAGKTTLVVGSGHSAGNALLDLARLAREEAGTTAIWATRGTDLARIYSGGDAAQLPARGELGAEVKELAESGSVTLVTRLLDGHNSQRWRQDRLSKVQRSTEAAASALSIASLPPRGNVPTCR